MKKLIVIIISLLLVGVVAGMFLWLRHEPMHNDVAQQAVWYCPMHPNYTSDHAGQCPICSMDLVKRKESTTQEIQGLKGYVPLTLDLRQEQLIGIKTVKVKRMPMKKMIRVFGHVAHDIELYEAQLEYVSAWQQYYAFRSRRTVTDEYRTDWREYNMKENGRAKNEDYRNSKLRLIKAEYVLTHMGITEQQLAQLREVKYGRLWVDPQLLYYQQGQSMWVYADIREDDIGYVAPHQKVIVEGFGIDQPLEGIVRSIANSVDINSRTVRVRIELLHVPKELTVNMFVDVTIESELNMALQLPLGAVIDTGVRQVVFLTDGKGHYEPQEVRVSTYSNGMVIIDSGVKEGDEVVLDGAFMLDSESRLRSSMQGFTEEKSDEK